jgi:hypothetical protein
LAVGSTAVFVLVIGYHLRDVLDAKKSSWIVGVLVLLAVSAHALQDFLTAREAENGGERAERSSKQHKENVREKVRSQSYSTIGDLITSPLEEQLPLKMEPRDFSNSYLRRS